MFVFLIYLFKLLEALCGFKEGRIIAAILLPELGGDLLLVHLQPPRAHGLAGGLIQYGTVSDAGGASR